MALQVLLGASQYDAATYVRSQIEDMPSFMVSDSALASYVLPVNEEFSSSVPLDWILGDPQGMSSPLVTVANQQRYVCSPGNGFPVPPTKVTGVSYLQSYFGSVTVQNEIALQQFLADATAGYASLFNVLADSPSTRIIRDLGLDELTRYNRGFYRVVLDGTTALPALDLYPVPQSSGQPIVVRYQTPHQIAHNATTGNYSVPTIPNGMTGLWARLFLIQVLEEEQDRAAKQKSVKAGLTEIQADVRQMEQRLQRLREDVNGRLGMHTGSALVSN